MTRAQSAAIVGREVPQAGEIWRASNGAERYVRDVDADEYSVVYSRSADSHNEWRTVLMSQWLDWVKYSGAKKMRKASAVKDWGYSTNV